MKSSLAGEHPAYRFIPIYCRWDARSLITMINDCYNKRRHECVPPPPPLLPNLLRYGKPLATRLVYPV